MSIILKNIFSVEFIYMWIRVVTPILLPALGGSLCNQAGVVNLGLEGMMLLSALGGVLASAYSSSAEKVELIVQNVLPKLVQIAQTVFDK